VTGKLPPETEKPVPEMESALIETGAVPLEVTVTDLVTAVPTETLPNAKDEELRLSAGVPTEELDPLSLMVVVLVVDPCVALSVTLCEAVTAATVATKVTLFVPAATVTDAGTVTAELLLARLTAKPVLGAEPLNDTVQLSVPAPIIEELAQVSPEREGDPFEPLPCSLVVLDDVLTLVERLVVAMLRVPVESAVDLAS